VLVVNQYPAQSFRRAVKKMPPSSRVKMTTK